MKGSSVPELGDEDSGQEVPIPKKRGRPPNPNKAPQAPSCPDAEPKRRGRKPTKKKFTNLPQLRAFIETNAGDPASLPGLQKLMVGAKISRRLLNAVISQLFELAEVNQSHLQWVRSAVESIQAHFFEPKRGSREALFFPSEESEQKFIDLIQQTKHELLCSLSMIENRRFLDAVSGLQSRGVSVKMIQHSKSVRPSDISNILVNGSAVEAGTECLLDDFVVVDGTIVITGTFCWPTQAPPQGYLTILDDETVVREFTQDFQRIWEQVSSLGPEVSQEEVRSQVPIETEHE